MSMHFTDKDSGDRASPSLNVDDLNLAPRAKSTDSIAHRAEGVLSTVGKVTIKNDKIIANDGTNNIALFGYDDAGSIVLKVAKPGFDANSAANSNLIFNSSQNTFKIVASGTTSLVTPDPMTAKQVVSTTIAHGLSTTPAFLLYLTVPNLGTAYVGSSSLQNTPFTLFTYNITPIIYVFGSVDGTNLTINIANLYNTTLSGAGATWAFRYYIMQETAATS